ncbi:MAG: AmmeMemoRadiSam system protein B [Alphaproteobacteria bacterium]|nr:AmmeMemoRadiSam system protein B [Alphaproteobacteria bacterium]
MSDIRRPAVAGMFYPADPEQLAAQVSACLAGEPCEGGPPKALIAPHAGYVYSGPVAGRAYARLAQARGRIERVVLVGPSHRVGFRGLAVGDWTSWGMPDGPVRIDREAVEGLKALPGVASFEAAHAQEHSLEVHLPFLRAVLGDFRLLPIVVGAADPSDVARALDAAWGGPETLVVISTDLSHYLDYDSARALDAMTGAAIERLDPAAIGQDQACGRTPVNGLLLVAQRRGLRVERIDLRNSGDTAGDRARVVGYGAWAFHEPVDGHGKALLDLARRSIRHALETGKPLKIDPATLPEALKAPGAAFVTLKRRGELRGCIGSVEAHRPLGEDVADNACGAAFSDPRFPPLAAEELDEVTLSVSVLTRPAPMAFASQADLLAQLRPRQDGLIIEDGGRRALFLPAVWETLPDPAGFLAHLKRKAGLAVDHWSGSFKAWRFAAIELRETP